MLSNLLSAFVWLVCLLSGLAVVLIGASAEGGRDGGRALAMMMVTPLFAGSLLSAFGLALWRGGIDWVATGSAAWRGWAVLVDPEGNELCVSIEPAGRPAGEAPDGPPARAFALCVDSARPVETAAWWCSVVGGQVAPGPDGQPRWLVGAAGLGDLTWKFVPVPEAKSVKNRVHWDVTTPDVAALVAAGAMVLREPDEEVRWTVLADPEGNEFCAFEEQPTTS